MNIVREALMRREKVEIPANIVSAYEGADHWKLKRSWALKGIRFGYVVYGLPPDEPVRSIYDLVRIELPLSQIVHMESEPQDKDEWERRDRERWYIGRIAEWLQLYARRKVERCFEELIELESLPLEVLYTFRQELQQARAFYSPGYVGNSPELQAEADAMDERLAVLDSLVLKAEQKTREEEEAREREVILNWMASGKKPGFVYLLRADNGHWKIGCASNPNNRLKTFNVKLPFDVQYEYLIPTNEMTRAEALLHERFSDKQVNGEWFALDADDVAWIKTLKKLDV